MTIYDFESDTYTRYDKKDVINGLKRLMEAEVICGHNIIDFDIPAIQKIYPWFTHKKVLDTLVMARAIFPDKKELYAIDVKAKYKMPPALMGRHKLEAWGYRVGEYKDGFGKSTDWKQWSQEMSDYCEQDVRVNVKVYLRLMKEGLSPVCSELEHQVAYLIHRQVQYGFLFNRVKAEVLYVTLCQHLDELTVKLKQVFKPWFVRNGEVCPKRDNKKKGVKALCSYTKIKLVEFNPASRHHIAYQLKKRYGWKPRVLTDSGEPKIDDEIIKKLPYPEAPLLAEYLMVAKRIGQLATGKKAWLKYLGTDGRMHGGVDSNGTATGRMAHKDPNVAQVPAVKVPYGHECRELFHVPSGYKLVGCDASGLELRCLAHYMAFYDGGKYAKVILEGDIHSVNQAAAGLPTRDNAKTFIYAFLYGAGDAKIGKIIKKGANEGRLLKAQFLKKTPALKKLRENVQKKVKEKGFLVGLDGRRLRIRSAHAALNTLLQSAGAVVMKKALCILYDDLTAAGLVFGVDYAFVANIHDEFQIEVKEELAEMVGKMAAESIHKAGEFFNFKCPLAGEYKIGNDWAETH